MGKTKWYTEPVPGKPGAGQRPAGTRSRSTSSTNAPGRIVQPTPEPLPMPILLRQIAQRLRRTWIALRFQGNRYTLGLFQRQAVLKFGVLLTAGYFLLFNENRTGLFATERTYLPEGAAVETSMEVSGESIFGGGGAPPANTNKPRPKKNDAAPVSAAELRDEQAEEYIERYQKTARQEMEKFGIPASISLAQGLIESRAGLSSLAQKNNNHFGIKCFSRRCARGHCTNHTDDTHKDFFRKFQSPWQSWRAHSQMLASGRYAHLKKYGRDYRKWAHGLKNIGYATDRTYAEKLIGVIERHGLDKFDR
jgi:flagellum-specific peptidoglycan hydrolase FlgJ